MTIDEFNDTLDELAPQIRPEQIELADQLTVAFEEVVGEVERLRKSNAEYKRMATEMQMMHDREFDRAEVADAEVERLLLALYDVAESAECYAHGIARAALGLPEEVDK